MAEKKKIFNQSMLDKLSSPDQLDKLIVIAPLPIRLFIGGGLLIIIVALIWSLMGWLSTTTATNGIYLSDTNANTYSSAKSGIVQEVYVKKGDHVKVGDKLFAFDTAATKKSIEDLEARKADIEAITLKSENDVVTQDSSDLISIKMQIASVGSESDKAYVMLRAYQDELNSINGKLSAAEQAENKAKEAYETAYVKSQIGAVSQYELADYQEKYTAAKSEHTTLLSKKESLEQQIASTTAQKDAAIMAEQSQIDSYEKQFEAKKSGIINTLNVEIDSNKKSLEECVVLAESDGTVSDIKVSTGSAVGQGNEYITIRQDNEGNGIIQCYVPIQTGKIITEGMEVIVYPTSVNRQEYGHMEAVVISVDGYTATEQEMMALLGDKNLVSAFAQKGPVMGVTCQLKEDPSTASGYYWSSKKGRSLELANATIVAADIVTEKEHPIARLIPYVKQKAKEFVGPKPTAEK